MGRKSKKNQRQRARGKQKSQSKAAPPPFCMGDNVVMYNLKNSIEHNGKVGKVVKLPKKSDPEGRFGILPENSSAPIAIRGTNLAQVMLTGANLRIGDHIVLCNLPDENYNGKMGKVVSLPKPNDPQNSFGILPEGSSSPFGVCLVNLALVQPSFKSTAQQLKERTDGNPDKRRDDHLSKDQLKNMRTMMGLFMTEEMELELFGRKIEPLPDFRKELREAGGFPIGVDKKWGLDHLEMAFEQSSNLPHMFEMMMKSPDYVPEPHYILKRLGTNDEDKVDWFSDDTRRRGDIYCGHQYNEYSSLVRHSYSNQGYRKEVLCRGTTHVAVGFVDLGILFAATLHPPPSGKVGPLMFLGVESCAYSVAKTHVIWEMLRQTPSAIELRNAHLRSIAQAWFSTTWGEGTHEVVKSALSSLCVPSRRQAYHPDVLKLLAYWNDAPVMSLQTARSKKAQFTSERHSCIAQLARKIDRIAMARYEVSGDFAIEGNCSAGNFLMFDCPDGTPPLMEDETVFSALSWLEIVDRLTPASTIIDAATAYTLLSISKLAAWAVEDHVAVDLIYARVEDVVEEIVARKPWTMSWSNVLDYIHPKEFHELARKCSEHGDTIHFGYSMNWPTNVMGVNVIDYGDASSRAIIFEKANESTDRSLKLLGWDQYLRLPPPVNPINTTSFALESMCWKKWTAFFFEIGKVDGPCKVLNEEHSVGSPLSSTGNSTVACTWTYDPYVVPNSIGPSIDPFRSNAEIDFLLWMYLCLQE